jgi:hypothetical protein
MYTEVSNISFCIGLFTDKLWKTVLKPFGTCVNIYSLCKLEKCTGNIKLLTLCKARISSAFWRFMTDQPVLPPHASVCLQNQVLRTTATWMATLVRDIHPFSKVTASLILWLHYGSKTTSPLQSWEPKYMYAQLVKSKLFVGNIKGLNLEVILRKIVDVT